jgi:hypothetical protein
MVEPASVALIGGMWAFSERKKYLMKQRREQLERDEQEYERQKQEAIQVEAEHQAQLRKVLKAYDYDEANELMRRICRSSGLSDQGIRKDLAERIR